MAWVKPPPPVPITLAMVTSANQLADRPRYGTAADWNMGAVGNDIDVSTASVAKVGSEGTGATGLPAMPTQAAKLAARVPPMAPASDIGQDYGTYDNLTGRTGFIGPSDPYPDSTSPTKVVSVIPGTGSTAGGTTVTISGVGFTGATAVTFGGTAGTSIVVGNSNTLTVTSPAKTAGAYDVVVTSPKGASQAGVKYTYA